MSDIALQGIAGIRSETLELTDELSKQCSSKLRALSRMAISEYGSLKNQAAADLKTTAEIPQMAIDRETELAIQNVTALYSSASGLISMTKATQALRYMFTNSGQRTTNYFLAFCQEGKGANSWLNKFTRFEASVSQIPMAVEQALHTPISNWNEVAISIVSAGGMKELATLFRGTPAEVVLEVVKSSLRDARRLEEMAASLGRQRNNVLRSVERNNREAVSVANSGAKKINEFQNIKTQYQNHLANLNSFESIDAIESPDDNLAAKAAQMKAYGKLVASGEKVIRQYHDTFNQVQAIPSKIERLRMSATCSLQIADSVLSNEDRLLALARQFEMTAYLRLYQLMITLATVSLIHSNRALANNRSEQLGILNDCRFMLQSIVDKRFEDVIKVEGDVQSGFPEIAPV